MTVDAPLVREATDHDSESEDLPSRMSRGSLSKLPTMPLDILLEVSRASTGHSGMRHDLTPSTIDLHPRHTSGSTELRIHQQEL